MKRKKKDRKMKTAIKVDVSGMVNENGVRFDINNISNDCKQYHY